jgi:hypothetical protein
VALLGLALVVVAGAAAAVVVTRGAGHGNKVDGTAAPATDTGFTPSAPPTGPTGPAAKVGQPVVYPDGFQVTLVGVTTAAAKGDSSTKAGTPLLIASFRVFNGTGAEVREPGFLVRARAGTAQYSLDDTVDGALGDAEPLSSAAGLERVEPKGQAPYDALPPGRAISGRYAFELARRADAASVALEVTPNYDSGELSPPAAVFSAGVG